MKKPRYFCLSRLYLHIMVAPPELKRHKFISQTLDISDY
jgi:hypothetical protein